MHFMRTSSHLGLDHAVDRAQVVDVGHGVVVLVLDQLVRELNLALVLALPHHHQVQVLGPLALHVRHDRADLGAGWCRQLGQVMLLITSYMGKKNSVIVVACIRVCVCREG